MRSAVKTSVFCVLLTLFSVKPAHALLVDKRDYIFDDASGLLWSKNDIQLDYTLSEARARVDALNFANTLVDVNSDGIQDSLMWSLAASDDLVAIYESYSLTERVAAFGQGTRTASYSTAVRWTARWKNLLAGWYLHEVFPGTGSLWTIQGGWGDFSDCFNFGGCSTSESDKFKFGLRGDTPKAGLWASATVSYGVPVPTTIFLIGVGLLGIAWRRWVSAES